MAATQRETRKGVVEFLGGREVADRAGASLTAMQHLGQIYRQQIEWFFEDQQTSFRKLAESDPLSVWVDHLSRRADHIGKGLSRLIDATRSFSEAEGTRRETLWAPLREASGSTANAAHKRSVRERLRMDHEHLHRILTVMEELARKGEGLDRAQLDVLMAGIDYIAEYPDCVHHPLEDRVFERLLATQLSAEERTRVETNAAKHQELTAATMQLQSDLRAMLDGQTDALVNLDHDVLEFIDGQRRHITFEEQYVFPLAERQLTRSDWQEIEAQEAEERDPLFDQRLTRYDGLYRYISAER